MVAFSYFEATAAVMFRPPLASVPFTVILAAVGGFVAGMFLTWVLMGLVSLASDWNYRAARRKREAEYEELRRMYPAEAKAVDELFHARLPSFSGK